MQTIKFRQQCLVGLRNLQVITQNTLRKYITVQCLSAVFASIILSLVVTTLDLDPSCYHDIEMHPLSYSSLSAMLRIRSTLKLPAA